MTNMTPDQELAYLAAFIDAEGWVSFRTGKTNRTYKQIGFTNTNEALFTAVVDLATRAGLHFTITHVERANERHSDRWNAILVGGRSAFMRFASIVPLMHPEKRARIDGILDHYRALDNAGRTRAAPIYNADYIARRAEISRNACAKRWAGHITKRPRGRTLTQEQKERRNFLARQRTSNHP